MEAFRSLYREAVRCRLRSAKPIGVTLSGGLDSGSVTAVAARELARGGRRLTAFSSVPLYGDDVVVPAGWQADETLLIRSTSDFLGNVDVNYLRCEGSSPVAAIKRKLQLNDAPTHAASNAFWILAILHAAQQMGIGTLLTGQGGNGTISWEGHGFRAPFYRSFVLRRLLARLSTAGIDDLAKYAVGSLSRAWKSVVSSRNRFRPDGGARDKCPWTDYSMINPSFARKMCLESQMRQMGHDPFFGPRRDSRQTRFAFIQPGLAGEGALWQQSGAAFGMEIRDPTSDNRIMEFCLGIPDEQHLDGCSNRRLIRRAMEGMLPREVRLNVVRGSQAPDLPRRLKENWGELDAALKEVSASTLAQEYLDLRRMCGIGAQIAQMTSSAAVGHQAIFLLRGLMVGLFLLTFEDKANHE